MKKIFDPGTISRYSYWSYENVMKKIFLKRLILTLNQQNSSIATLIPLTSKIFLSSRSIWANFKKRKINHSSLKEIKTLYQNTDKNTKKKSQKIFHLEKDKINEITEFFSWERRLFYVKTKFIWATFQKKWNKLFNKLLKDFRVFNMKFKEAAL